MITFVEDEKFVAAADKILTEGERDALMAALAGNPRIGDVIPGSGGCRKLRVAARGKGTRGGARVIYFPHLRRGQILLLEIYCKARKNDLTASEIKTLQQKIKS